MTNRLKRVEKRRIRKDQKRVVFSNQKVRKLHLALIGEDNESEEDLEDLDEDQITRILKDEGLMAKDEEELKAIKLYVGVDCKSSFFLFTKESCFRTNVYKFIKNPNFDNSIMVLIGLSSLKLAVDTYFLTEEKGSKIL